MIPDLKVRLVLEEHNRRIVAAYRRADLRTVLERRAGSVPRPPVRRADMDHPVRARMASRLRRWADWLEPADVTGAS